MNIIILFIMPDASKSERFKLVKHMLFDMAFGSTSIRIKVMHQDAIAAVEVVVNNLANLLQEIKSTDTEESFLFSPQNSSTHVILIDTTGTIAAFNDAVLYLLNYKETELMGIPFQLVLSTNAVLIWQEMQRKITASPEFELAEVLVFRTKDEHFFSAFCSIFKMTPADLIAVCFVSQNNSKRTPALYELPLHMILHASDVKGIYDVRDFILAHLDEPLPLVPKLARIFYIEEHKLSSGFRLYFNSSVYQFYHEARLQKAHLLIEQSKFTLLDVAFKCGFTTYNNFYKAFKARFSYTPTSVTRRSHK